MSMAFDREHRSTDIFIAATAVLIAPRAGYLLSSCSSTLTPGVLLENRSIFNDQSQILYPTPMLMQDTQHQDPVLLKLSTR